LGGKKGRREKVSYSLIEKGGAKSYTGDAEKRNPDSLAGTRNLCRSLAWSKKKSPKFSQHTIPGNMGRSGVQALVWSNGEGGKKGKRNRKGSRGHYFAMAKMKKSEGKKNMYFFQLQSGIRKNMSHLSSCCLRAGGEGVRRRLRGGELLS